MRPGLASAAEGITRQFPRLQGQKGSSSLPSTPCITMEGERSCHHGARQLGSQSQPALGGDCVSHRPHSGHPTALLLTRKCCHRHKAARRELGAVTSLLPLFLLLQSTCQAGTTALWLWMTRDPVRWAVDEAVHTGCHSLLHPPPPQTLGAIRTEV